MLKAAFNQFDPKQVLSDLYAHQEWWKSFVMGPPLPEEAEDPLDRILLTLRDLGYRWKADTLYVLTRDDENVFPLLNLGKGWHCDCTKSSIGLALDNYWEDIPHHRPLWSIGGTEKSGWLLFGKKGDNWLLHETAKASRTLSIFSISLSSVGQPK